MNNVSEELQDKSLFHTDLFIDGKWQSTEKHFSVSNPANRTQLAEVAFANETEIDDAIRAAHRAFVAWKKVDVAQRAKVLSRWCGLLHENKEDLGRLMNMEQGKPYREAVGEIKYAASYLEYYSEEAKRIKGDLLSSPFANAHTLVLKQPVGVVGIITPWNFPAAMFIRKVAPALAAGCTCVVKPDERTPLTAYAIMELGRRAGLPPGVVNMITGDPPEIGKRLATHPKVAKISFTGSTQVGKLLMRWASGTVKRISLELGGNAPFIVFSDADLEEAVKGLMLSKFRNSGQTCICVNRVFVHASVIKPFAVLLEKAIHALKVGDSITDYDLGPLIDESAVHKVDRLVRGACDAGAHLCCGGKRLKPDQLFYAPTVLKGVTPDMDIFKEEIFGPVVTLIPFEAEEEVLEMANNTPYGLASYFYTRDAGRIWLISKELEYGMVGVNTGSISTAWAPFGGIKQSGFGREGSAYGMEEYLQIKYVNWHE